MCLVGSCLEHEKVPFEGYTLIASILKKVFAFLTLLDAYNVMIDR